VYITACFFEGLRDQKRGSHGSEKHRLCGRLQPLLGTLKGGPHKWLNLETYFRLLRKDDDLCHIHYFTALVEGPWQEHQLTYLKALATLSDVSIHMGRFKKKRVKCAIRACPYEGGKWFHALEEKRTDVHIAVQMLCDSFENRCDNVIVVSGDSDLVPAVSAVKTRFPDKRMIVYIPSRDPVRGAAVELRSAADRHRVLPMGPLKAAQFPTAMTDRNGNELRKPEGWL